MKAKDTRVSKCIITVVSRILFIYSRTIKLGSMLVAFSKLYLRVF
jgi:hypothetical protein